jgi:hypothetical protein
MVDDLTDPRRVEPPFLLHERAMLEGWLEFTAPRSATGLGTVP